MAQELKTLVHKDNIDIAFATYRLEGWYKENKRPLPWRASQDPYPIWISEVMLQQTTVKAVIPFFERFMTRFPSIHKLAQAKIEDVYELWAGLGYYSRARNVHKSAQLLNDNTFPQTFEDLLKFPGFGPYTARAVASLAFEQPVGVLDGNVIRVLCRVHGKKELWWTTAGRKTLQDLVDGYARLAQKPSQINQALMELGATVCTPEKPACLLCPLAQVCVAQKTNRTQQLPLSRPRRENEIWIWQPEVILNKDRKIALMKNDYAPFLRGHWILPGKASRRDKPPKSFKVRHSITHHNIFVQPQVQREALMQKNLKWVALKNLPQHAPSSLLKKVLQSCSLLTLAFTVSTSIMLGCTSTKKVEKVQAQPNFRTVAEPRGENGAIVTLGVNQSPRFSKDGNSLFFVGQRAGSQHPQVYSIDLASRQVRRLTFQNGTISSLTIASPQLLLFSSNTEQLRDFTLALDHFKGQASPSAFGQLFEYNLTNSTTRPITDEPGLQTDGVLWTDGTLLFLWEQPNIPRRIFRLKKNRFAPALVNAEHCSQLRLTTQQELHWLQRDKENKNLFKIFKSNDLQKVQEVLSLPFPVTEWDYSQQLNMYAFIRQDTGQLIFWSSTQNCWLKPQDLKLEKISGLSFHPTTSQMALSVDAKEGGSIFLWDVKSSSCSSSP